MLYQCGNGKTRILSVEQYLSMSDEDLRALEYTNTGFEINDPFFDSILDDEMLIDDVQFPDVIDELPENFQGEE